MNKNSFYLLGAITLSLMFQVSLTRACKYSVRDVAFVDLGVQPYLLRFAHGEKDEALSNQIRAVLKGTNIRFEFVASDQTSMVMVAPDGRKLNMKTDAVLDATKALVNSRLGQRLKNLALHHHSVVLLINGSDEVANAHAKQSADAAAASISATLDSLPKPIDRGPVVLVVDAETARAERVLLWALGIELDQTDQADQVNEASIAIIYGRLRRLGPLLKIPPSTSVDLIANMNLVGQDCECELERSWMTGPMIPHRWTSQDEAAAAKALEFDPGSPLVRSEIQRILARGPSALGPRNERIGEARPIDPLLGYSEVEIGSNGEIEDDPSISADDVASNTTASLATNEVIEDHAPNSSQLVWILVGLAVAIIIAVGIRMLRQEGRR